MKPQPMSQSQLEEDRTNGEPPESQPESDRSNSFLRALARLALVGLFGVAIGVGLYLAVPALVQAWLEPVQHNQAEIEALTGELAQVRREQRAVNAELAGQAADLEAQLVTLTERTDEAEFGQGDLVERMNAIERQLDGLQATADQVAQLETDIADLVAAVAALEADAETALSIEILAYRLNLISVMEIVARARLELLQENFGLADDSLQAAYDRLSGLTPPAGMVENETLAAALSRLALAEVALPGSPQVAAEDLEGVWRLLLEMTEPMEAGS